MPFSPPEASYGMPSTPAYTTRVLESIHDVTAETWDALVGDDESPFVEHAWLEALEDTGCVGRNTGWLSAHLGVWRGDTLVGAAPTYVKSHSAGEFVFDWSWADYAERIGIEYYPKIVVAVPFTPATGLRVLVAPGEDRSHVVHLMAQTARSLCENVGASGVHVLFPRDDEANLWESTGYLRRDGYQYHWFRHGASTFDDYLARFSSKHRNQIKREIRVVKDAGIDVSVLRPEEYTNAMAQAMHRFYKITVERHGPWGRLYLTPAFFARTIETLRHRMAWIVARDARTGAVVGGAFNVTKGNRLFGRYWGANAEVPCLHFVTCYYESVRYCIERRLDVFEPGAGGEHKRARGFAPTLTHSAHWLRDTRLRNALRPWLTAERARVAELAGMGGDADA